MLRRARGLLQRRVLRRHLRCLHRVPVPERRGVGLHSTYCQADAGKKSPKGKAAADAIISCLTTTCGTDTACGTPQRVTWDNFAAEFSENFCNGCHSPGFQRLERQGRVQIRGRRPQRHPAVQRRRRLAICLGRPQGQPGLEGPDQLRSREQARDRREDLVRCLCHSPGDVRGRFPGPLRQGEALPPAGADPSSTSAPSCVWTDDGSCPQPTEFERNQMVSWVFDGTPQQ